MWGESEFDVTKRLQRDIRISQTPLESGEGGWFACNYPQRWSPPLNSASRADTRSATSLSLRHPNPLAYGSTLKRPALLKREAARVFSSSYFAAAQAVGGCNGNGNTWGDNARLHTQCHRSRLAACRPEVALIKAKACCPRDCQISGTKTCTTERKRDEPHGVIAAHTL